MLRFSRKVNALCVKAGRPEAITAGAMSPEDRARELRAERRILQKLAAALEDVRPPPGLAERMKRYRRRLADQIFLDGRIIRAATANDAQAIAVGVNQNEINRGKRTTLAKRLHFSRCLRDRRER